MNQIVEFELKDLSVFDDNMPVEFLRDVIAFRLEQSNRVVSKIYDEVTKECDGQVLELPKEDRVRFVMDIDDEKSKDILDGKIKLVTENGNTFAQLRENGRYGKKLPVREEVYKDELGEFKLQYALQMKSLQDSLYLMNEKLSLIDENVRSVINGQQNDRIALYYSGASLFSESLCVSDQSLKRLLMAQSIKSLTESIFKLTLIMGEDIQFLKSGNYKGNKRRCHSIVCEKLDSIRQCYSILHKSSILKAAIYGFQGEMKASASVLLEYSNFIDEYIIKNKNLLVQLDPYDDGTDAGIWKSQVLLGNNVKNIAQKLEIKDDVFYLDMKVEEE